MIPMFPGNRLVCLIISPFSWYVGNKQGGHLTCLDSQICLLCNCLGQWKMCCLAFSQVHAAHTTHHLPFGLQLPSHSCSRSNHGDPMFAFAFPASVFALTA